MAIPSDFSGLELWFKDTGFWQDSARTTPATANGDPIGAWDDQSGNGRHLTQPTSGNRPTLDTTGLGGHSAVNFAAASSQRLNIPNVLTGFTAGEIFCVIQCNADPGAGDSGSGLWAFGSQDGVGGWGDVHPWTDSKIYSAFGSTAFKINGVLPTWRPLTQWHYINALSSSSLWFYRINMNELFKTVTNTVGWTTAPRLGSSKADTRFLSGKIVEWWFSSVVYTEAQRSELIKYLNVTQGYNLFQATPVAQTGIVAMASRGVASGAAQQQGYSLGG